MTTIITANGTKFNLRNKFGRLVNDENREAISNAFEKLCGLKVDDARNLLWHMTYSADSSDDFAQLGLAEDVISFTEVDTICQEFSHQYEKHHPGCFDVTVPDGDCKTAFDALKNKTDSIVAYVVHQHMNVPLYLDAASVSRILFLLKSDSENNFFGGLRSLRFSLEEADFLKPYHVEVHDLLKALYDHKKANSTPDVTKPFADLGKRIAESGMQLAPDRVVKPATPVTTATDEADAAEAVEEEFLATVEQAADEIRQKEPSFMSVTPEEFLANVRQAGKEIRQKKPNFMAITPETVLQHKDSIQHYLNALATLSEIGFNPAEVQAKANQINTLLEAFKAF